MSIKIPSPSIVLNSDAWNVCDYKMDISISIPKTANILEVFNNAADECLKLKNTFGRGVTMIINSHGAPGFISLGMPGLGRYNVWLFSKFATTVSTIVIDACKVAAIGEPTGWSDGNLFCAGAAMFACAQVQASQDTQKGTFWREQPGYIDDWEGTVLTYGPDGSVIKVDQYDKVLF